MDRQGIIDRCPRLCGAAAVKLDLAVVGNLLVDDIVYEDGRTRMAQPGGATPDSARQRLSP